MIQAEETARFAELGVAEENIFQEILRARHVDSVLFADASNKLYGVTEETIAAAVTKLQLPGVPPYAGDPAQYLPLYQAALWTDPTPFLPLAQSPEGELVAAWWERALAQLPTGSDVLVVGGRALYRELKRLAAQERYVLHATVPTAEEAQRWQVLLPAVQWQSEAAAATRQYDGVLVYARDGRSRERLTVLAAGGAFAAWDALPATAPEADLTAYVYAAETGESLLLSRLPREEVVRGYAYYEHGAFRYETSEPEIWEQSLWPAEPTLATAADVVTATGEAPLRGTEQAVLLPREAGSAWREGDLVVLQDSTGYRVLWVAAAQAARDLPPYGFVLRAQERQTALALYAFLHSAAGRRAICAGRAAFAPQPCSAWLRLPLPPAVDSVATERFLAAAARYAAAQTAWEDSLEAGNE